MVNRSCVKKFIIRRIASKSLLYFLAFAGSLFFTKDLIYDIAFPNDISITFFCKLLYVGLFFLVFAFAFWFLHADDLLRNLTLKITQDPVSYFIYFSSFIKSRFGCKDRGKISLKNPAKAYYEINRLLEIGQELFKVNHKRTISFLLGIDYTNLKRELVSLQEKIDYKLQKPFPTDDNDEIENKITDVYSTLEGSLINPLKDIEKHLEHLIFILRIVQEPSYDNALYHYYVYLFNVVTMAIKSVNNSKNNSKEDSVLREILKEVHEIFCLIKKKGKARIGYPLYECIDTKLGKKLTTSLDQIKEYQEEKILLTTNKAEIYLKSISGNLEEFEKDIRKRSNDHLKMAISENKTKLEKLFEKDKDIIMLYGYSKTVFGFVKTVISKDINKRTFEIILIKTGKFATTGSEEQTIRNLLIEEGFTNIHTYSFGELLVTKEYGKKLNLILGFEIINSDKKEAIFHFGAGQYLSRIIKRLLPDNKIKIYLLGSSYKEIAFNIEDESVMHSSVFNYAQYDFVWLNESIISQLT